MQFSLMIEYSLIGCAFIKLLVFEFYFVYANCFAGEKGPHGDKGNKGEVGDKGPVGPEKGPRGEGGYHGDKVSRTLFQKYLRGSAIYNLYFCRESKVQSAILEIKARSAKRDRKASLSSCHLFGNANHHTSRIQGAYR